MGSDDEELERESEIHRLAYEGGNKAALLLMIRYCLLLQWPVPEWAARAFVDACSYVEMGGARSWDDVFGQPHRGRHRGTVALENRKYGIHKRVRRLHERGVPIGDGLFERVGRVFGRVMNPNKKPISKTVISDLYYHVEGTLHRIEETSGK
jgi:hypothetical protein